VAFYLFRAFIPQDGRSNAGKYQKYLHRNKKNTLYILYEKGKKKRDADLFFFLFFLPFFS